MATSITNTSVTTDNLTVDTQTLKVDSTNNRVGINTTTPDAALQVQNGDITVGWADNFIGTQFQDGTDFRLGMKFGTVNRTTKIVAETNDNNGEITFETNGTERMRVDTVGRVTMPYQPAFRVGKTSAQQASGGSYIDPISFDVASYNIGNHFNLSTNKFTAPIAGRYLFGWLLGAYRYSATWLGVYSYVNNAYLDYTQSFNYSAPSWVNMDGSILVNLQVNDTFHIVLRNDSNAGVDNSGCMWGYLVG